MITLLNLVLLGLVGLTPYVARMIAEAGPTRALPFYLIAVGARVRIDLVDCRRGSCFLPSFSIAGVDRAAFRLELLSTR